MGGTKLHAVDQTAARSPRSLVFSACSHAGCNGQVVSVSVIFVQNALDF